MNDLIFLNSFKRQGWKMPVRNVLVGGAVDDFQTGYPHRGTVILLFQNSGWRMERSKRSLERFTHEEGYILSPAFCGDVCARMDPPGMWKNAFFLTHMF